jgi:hypothetical protein
VQVPHLDLHTLLVRLGHQHHAHVPLRLLARRVAEQLAAVGKHQVALLVEAVEVALYLPAVLELDLRPARSRGRASAWRRGGGMWGCRQLSARRGAHPEAPVEQLAGPLERRIRAGHGRWVR